MSELGRREDALAATREATDIYRRLAAERPDAFLPDLAGSLNNLGSRLSELGRREDALAAAREATDIYRRLAAERPDAFLPVSRCRSTISAIDLSGLGRREDALEAARRSASDIYRRLAADRPDAFLPVLAMSLRNLGNRLSELGRREDALAATHEAVTLLGPFFLRFPAAYAQWMAVSYNQYLELSEKIGVEPDAALLSPIVEAFRKLQGSPDAGPSNST